MQQDRRVSLLCSQAWTVAAAHATATTLLTAVRDDISEGLEKAPADELRAWGTHVDGAL